MSDLMKSLAQLRQVRHDGPDAPTEPEQPKPDMGRETLSIGRGEEKTLAGRVPLSLHRELTRTLLDAADELGVRRVYVDEALEAAVRIVLRGGETHKLWLQEVQQVRREKVGG